MCSKASMRHAQGRVKWGSVTKLCGKVWEGCGGVPNSVCRVDIALKVSKSPHVHASCSFIAALAGPPCSTSAYSYDALHPGHWWVHPPSRNGPPLRIFCCHMHAVPIHLAAGLQAYLQQRARGGIAPAAAVTRLLVRMTAGKRPQHSRRVPPASESGEGAW